MIIKNKVIVVIGVIFVCEIIVGRGIIRVISTSKIKKITAIK